MNTQNNNNNVNKKIFETLKIKKSFNVLVFQYNLILFIFVYV